MNNEKNNFIIVFIFATEKLFKRTASFREHDKIAQNISKILFQTCFFIKNKHFIIKKGKLLCLFNRLVSISY